MDITTIVAFFQNHSKDLLDVVAYTVFLASAIVKITPTTKDDSFVNNIIHFVGKYIALNKYGPEGANATDNKQA